MADHMAVDLHRRRLLAMYLDEGGDRLWRQAFENSPRTVGRGGDRGRTRSRGGARGHVEPVPDSR
jgi:hypothetical protein